ncbi:MAG: hypothetical protein CMA74_03060 [Euryarchaeota archaeon]|jgi:predicted fused transcriptional regulator/phosphomethylpyrimidine kinase|nr:hypothetical protein [Euryarchaeota archaeon]|tara:strand:+ start:121 stop:927 length:807 start_codon:yes stop_codon:yes gene_type:complete
MMPVELNGNLLKELRGRTCRILADEGWTQSNLGSALGVSQVMAGNYLHTLPTRYSEPTESNLQEASLSLAEILKSEESFSWSLNITADDHVLSINFPSQDNKEKILSRISEMRRRLETVLPLLSPQVRVNIAIAANDAKSSSDIAAFPGRLTPVGGKARPLSSPKFGGSNHLSDLLLELRNFDSKISTIINLRWDPMIAEILEKLDINFIKLQRDNDDLLITKKVIESNVMVDEGGYGLEPSLYIFSSDNDFVCKTVEDVASMMKVLA